MRMFAIALGVFLLWPICCQAKEPVRVDSGFHPSLNAPWIVNSDSEHAVGADDARVFLNFYPRSEEFLTLFDEGLCLGLVRTAAQLFETGFTPEEVATDLVTGDPESGLGYVVIDEAAAPQTAYIDTRSDLFDLIIKHQAGFQIGETINGLRSGLLTTATFLLGSHGREVNRFYSSAEEVCQQIDAGHPWPVTVASLDGPTGHAVLAYAYERADEAIKLYVYDPNQLPSDYFDADTGALSDPDYLSITWTGVPEVHLTSGLGARFAGQWMTPFEPDPLYDPEALELRELLTAVELDPTRAS